MSSELIRTDNLKIQRHRVRSTGAWCEPVKTQQYSMGYTTLDPETKVLLISCYECGNPTVKRFGRAKNATT